jgi:hypothetical protein
MVRKVKKGRWSYKEDRCLLEFAASSVSDRMGRSPSVSKKAPRLGASLKTRAKSK